MIINNHKLIYQLIARRMLLQRLIVFIVYNLYIKDDTLKNQIYVMYMHFRIPIRILNLFSHNELSNMYTFLQSNIVRLCKII